MPKLSEAELSQNYGFAMAVLNSDPELKALFKKAVAETWTPERFQASLRSTKWYQNHSEQWRNASILKASDPASYKANVEQVKVRLLMMATELGANLGSKAAALAEQAYQFGWDDNQIRQTLSTFIKYTDGRLLGQAGQWETDLRALARAQGLSLSDSWFRNRITSAVSGKATIDDAKGAINQMAASAFPHLADRIRAGETLSDISDPYRQSMASLLELNPEAVSLDDRMVRGALAAKDKDGKPVMKSLWEFENDVRKDKRWLKTSNAQDSAMSVTRKILSDFGLVN